MKINMFIPHLTKMPNQLLRRHWSLVMNEKKRWHSLISAARSRLNPELMSSPPFKKVKLKLVRHSTSQPDYDGLVGSFKYVIDALVKAGFFADDCPDVVSNSEYEWEKSKRSDQGISIEIEEA